MTCDVTNVDVIKQVESLGHQMKEMAQMNSKMVVGIESMKQQIEMLDASLSIK